jgi:hypothetical protein
LLPVCGVKSESRPPANRFRQADRPHCIGVGAANAVDAAGNAPLAETLAAEAKRFRQLGDLARLVGARDLGTAPQKPRLWYPEFERDPELAGLKDWLLANGPHPHPVVCQVRDQDGNQNHSVTVWDSYIFDGNEPFALPLTQGSLDRCVTPADTEAGRYTCQAVRRAYALVPVTRKRRRTESDIM